jgi:hypothetical protein
MDMVVTIEDVEPNVMTHDNRKVMILHFEEFPKHNFWLSPKGIRILADKFGKKFTEWLGQKVPLVIVDAENPETGEQVDSLQVAAQVDWEDLMTVQPTAAMRERAAATTRKAARKSTGKTARKRR